MADAFVFLAIQLHERGPILARQDVLPGELAGDILPDLTQ